MQDVCTTLPIVDVDYKKVIAYSSYVIWHLVVLQVALDGTYGNAARQWKYLRQSLEQLDSKVPLPVVKLDLELGRCNSAVAGIMHQPGKEKICTYQVSCCLTADR